MHVDSRNPLLYCCVLRIDDSFGNTFCGKHLHGREVVERGYLISCQSVYTKEDFLP